MLTSHELARKLLEGPDCPVVYVDNEYGPDLVDEVRAITIKLSEDRKEVTGWRPSPNEDTTGFEVAVELI